MFFKKFVNTVSDNLATPLLRFVSPFSFGPPPPWIAILH